MNPFWNSNERRLRSLLRIVLQLILYLLFALGLVFIMSDLLMPLIPPDSPLLVIRFRNNFLLGELTSPLIALGATLLSMFLAAKFLDKRRFCDFGFHREKGWWNDFFFGLGLGAVLMAFIFLVELSLGWIRVIGFFSPRAGNPFWLGILIDLITFICVGIYEEMLLRGYVLRNLAEGMNFKRLKPTTAVLLATFFSSVIFSLLHLTNPGASILSFINLLIGGIFLSLGFILTGELAIPIGLHIAWNFFQGVVFGFPVSGVAAINPVISIEQTLNNPITGGIFGPEAGAIGLLATFLGSFLILAWCRKLKGNITLQASLAVYQVSTKPSAALPPENSPQETD
jgi:membrane protease YdiL (CAAX protease family)